MSQSCLRGLDESLFQQLSERFPSSVCVQTLLMTVKCSNNAQTLVKVDGELKARKCTVLRYQNIANIYHQKELVSLDYSGTNIEHTAVYIVPVLFIMNKIN